MVGFEGTRDGAPFEGGSSERMPLILGDERFIPGFESNLEGMRVGESKEFDVTFPKDYPETTLAGKPVHFRVELKELREKVLPEADDALFQSLANTLKQTPSRRMTRLPYHINDPLFSAALVEHFREIIK